MIVICCGMMRSASTLQYQIVVELGQRLASVEPLGYILPEQFSEIVTKNRSRSGFVVLKSHAFLEESRELLRHNDALGIYAYRDIRDVIVSLMRMQGVSFNKLGTGILYVLLEQYVVWTSQHNVLVSQYEGIVNDTTAEVLRIANHMQLSCTHDLAEEIAQKFSLEHQRRRQFRLKEDQEFDNDRDSLLHTNHIHSGMSAQWMNELSSDEVGLVEHVFSEWLDQVGYQKTIPTFRRYLSAIRHRLRKPASLLTRFGISRATGDDIDPQRKE